MQTAIAAAAILGAALLIGCADNARLPATAGVGSAPALPPPTQSAIPTIAVAPAEGWAEEEAPTPASDLRVTAFARGLDHPRWLLVLPNGDVLVAETNAQPSRPKSLRGVVMKLTQGIAGAEVPSPDRILLLRDADGDGVAETRTVFLAGLTSPFGMALVGNDLYVANTNALVRFPYRSGETQIAVPGTEVAALPAGEINHHWTKGLVASPDGRAMFVSVGSNSDHGENGIDAEKGRAAILEIDPATGATKVFAAGLRNPVGMDFEPRTGTLWTVVNERDELGGDLVPDYLTSVQAGSFYGWPYSYYGDHLDPRVLPQRPDLVARARVPDYALGAARRAARPDLCRRREARPSFCQRRFHWPARLLEPQATVRLSGDLRAVPSGPPGRPTRGSADRIPRRRWQRPRPTGRRCHRQARRSPRRRRRRQRCLAA